MKNIPWSAGTWTRNPVSVVEEGSSLVIESFEGSDWWRTTSY
ncbi:MAG: hypothetical protein RLZZ311_135, partial [Actinomycetota bacterium]